MLCSQHIYSCAVNGLLRVTELCFSHFEVSMLQNLRQLQSIFNVNSRCLEQASTVSMYFSDHYLVKERHNSIFQLFAN